MRPPIPARPAAPAPLPWILTKTLIQTAAFWATFLWLIPSLIARVEHAWSFAPWTSPALRVAATALFVAAGTIGLSSAAIMALRGRGTPLPFDCPSRLVIAGPYRYIRNPMAVAGLAQGLAVGLYLGSTGTILYVAAGMLLWNHLVRRWEEHDLESRIGNSFRHYQEHVRCWLPRATPYTPPPPRSATPDS